MSGQDNGGGNRWTTPGVLFGILGMVASIIAAWLSFESRVTKVETSYDAMDKRLGRMDDKLDRLIERRN